MTFPPLDVLQRWMQSVMTTGGAAESGLVVDDLVTPSRAMSPQARLEIYQRAYFARLFECMCSEFPAVRHAAGEEAFAGLVAGYLRSSPSTSYTLAELGRDFPDHLERTRPASSDRPDFADFLIDLARLERTYAEVFDAAGPERSASVTAADLASRTSQEFALARLVFHDTVRLLSLRFPCHEYASAVRQGSEPTPPSPAATRLVVFRRDFVVRRMAVSAVQFEILCALQRGECVGDSISAAAKQGIHEPVSAEMIRSSFATWGGAELFRALIVTGGADRR